MLPVVWVGKRMSPRTRYRTTNPNPVMMNAQLAKNADSKIGTGYQRRAGLLQMAECIETGEMVSIYDVPNGKGCNCVLPGTDLRLVARNKGKKEGQQLLPGQRAAHFALTKGANPNHAIETAIHKFAKNVLAQTKKLWMPELKPSSDWDSLLDRALSRVIPIELPHKTIEKLMQEGMSMGKEKLLEKYRARLHEFGAVDLESKMLSTDDDGWIVADAVGVNNGITNLLIEFHFTNPVSAEKKARIQSLNRSCLEIDLSTFVQLDEFGKINREAMVAGLQSEWGFPKHWVHNAKQERIEKSVIDDVARRMGAKARRWFSNYKQQRSPKYLKHRIEAGFNQLKVYSFNNNESKVYCPMAKTNEGTVPLAECQKCRFFGQYHFEAKSDELRESQPMYIAKYAEEMSVLCGHVNGVERTALASPRRQK